jgi:hypothetical protein
MNVITAASSLLIAVCAMILSLGLQTSGYVSWAKGDSTGVSGTARARQVSTQQKPETEPEPKPEPKPGKKLGTVGVHVTGKISDDGKTFVSDTDSKSWTIANPEAMKGHEGHHVTLTVRVDADKNEVHVTSLKMAKMAKMAKKAKKAKTAKSPQ